MPIPPMRPLRPSAPSLPHRPTRTVMGIRAEPGGRGSDGAHRATLGGYAADAHGARTGYAQGHPPADAAKPRVWLAVRGSGGACP